MASRLLSHTAVLVLILCAMPVRSKMPDDYISIRGDQELVVKICLIGSGVFDKFYGKTDGNIRYSEALDAGMMFDLDRYSMQLYAKFEGLAQGRKDTTATVEMLYAMRPGFHVDLHIKNLDITSVRRLSVEFRRDGL